MSVQLSLNAAIISSSVPVALAGSSNGQCSLDNPADSAGQFSSA